MQELIRTNDVVLISFVESLMKEAGIRHFVADQNTSIMEGSLGVLPRRLMVEFGPGRTGAAHPDGCRHRRRAASEGEMSGAVAVPAGAGETVDAFHRGRFHLVQPLGRGHRAGIDAMLLAALVPDGARGRLADLGAGAGAAGLAAAARLPGIAVTLVEHSAEMAGFARRTLALPENRALAARVSVVEADVTLSGRARLAAGLGDEVFDHVIMNPPFNDGSDRRAPDLLKAAAHAMTGDLFESWIRTAGAIARPGAQLSLIARPQSLGEIFAACGRRFGGVEVTALHPRRGEDAIRVLLTAIKGSRARLTLRAPLVLHEDDGHAFSPFVDDLNNGRRAYCRRP